MDTKRILRLAIVLFLLAVLPVMTVALAQEQEPAGKQLPVDNEVAESVAPAWWDWYENEPNNSIATARKFPGFGVMGGVIDSPGDVDYFELPEDYSNYQFLYDIDTWPSPLDLVMCLVDSEGDNITCNDDSDGLDPMILDYGAHFDKLYIKVFEYEIGQSDPRYEYQLFFSHPLLVSAAPGGLGTGNVGGVPFQSGDVLAHTQIYDLDKWVMIFDASDVGVKTLSNLAGGHLGDNFLFSVGGIQTLPGIGTVKPWDVIRFDSLADQSMYGPEWQQFGSSTRGTFSLEMKGSQHQLTTVSEKLDAIDDVLYNCLGVSTTGVAKVNWPSGILKQDDEDLFCIDGNSARPFLDVNGVNDGPYTDTIPGLPAEDVIAFDAMGFEQGYIMTILGTGRINGVPVNQKDIFWYHDGNGSVTYLWRGPQHGWNYNLDAIEFGVFND